MQMSWIVCRSLAVFCLVDSAGEVVQCLTYATYAAQSLDQSPLYSGRLGDGSKFVWRLLTYQCLLHRSPVA